MKKIKTGIYHHFKGALVEVIGVGKHSETLERFVLYRHLGDGKLWVRPKAMFSEKVLVKGKKVPRFAFLRAKNQKKK